MNALQAIADVIYAMGFHAMSRDFMDRPEHRARIATNMQREMARTEPVKAQRFGLLCREVLARTK